MTILVFRIIQLHNYFTGSIIIAPLAVIEGSLQSLDWSQWTGLDSDDVIDNVLLHLRAGFDYLEYLIHYTYMGRSVYS